MDTKVAFFEEEWNSIEYPFIYNEIEDVSVLKKPENLSEMVRLVKKLAESYNYVRIDMYRVDNKICLGEYTFTPGGGIDKFKSYSNDLERELIGVK